MKKKDLMKALRAIGNDEDEVIITIPKTFTFPFEGFDGSPMLYLKSVSKSTGCPIELAGSQ